MMISPVTMSWHPFKLLAVYDNQNSTESELLSSALLGSRVGLFSRRLEQHVDSVCNTLTRTGYWGSQTRLRIEAFKRVLRLVLHGLDVQRKGGLGERNAMS
jgi:hypothetical protein